MEPEHQELLRRFRSVLSEQLLVSDSIVPFLFQEEVLTHAQVEDIEAQPTNRKKNLKLLDLLIRCGPRAFSCFLRALDEHSWLRDRLLLELRTGIEPGAGATEWQLPDALQLTVPSDLHLSRLASRLGADWEAVLIDLGVSAVALFRCRSDHMLSAHGAALAALLLWRRAEGRSATLQRLVESLRVAGVHPSILKDIL